jgi:FdhD protein
VPDSTRPVHVVKFAGPGRQRTSDLVAVEAPLEVRIGGRPFAVIMRTPGADEELAAGFLFAERIIQSVANIRGIAIASADPDAAAVDVTLIGCDLDALFRKERRVLATAACGACGRPDLSALVMDAPSIASSWRMRSSVLPPLPDAIRASQAGFQETGGVHAAALFDDAGRVLLLREDVGRHNAVDKVVGRRLLDGALPAGESGLFVSGRASFEIVQKAWLAGIPLIAAVSAPSSLAVDLAAEAGITLAGFLRGDRFNVYTHRERLIE